VFVLLENQLAMLLPKIVTTAISNTAIKAMSRPYSVTAIADSSRRKRRIEGMARWGSTWLVGNAPKKRLEVA
jgi:hypothetical protein